MFKQSESTELNLILTSVNFKPLVLTAAVVSILFLDDCDNAVRHRWAHGLVHHKLEFREYCELVNEITMIGKRLATVEVLSLKKCRFYESSVTEEYIKDNETTFRAWNLTKQDIHDIMLGSETINGTTWDLEFDVEPWCYTGEVMINGLYMATYRINAGSFFDLQFEQSGLHFGPNRFGYYGKHKYFITPPYTPDD